MLNGINMGSNAQGPMVGSLPNMYCTSLVQSKEELRCHPSFRGLPPAHMIQIHGKTSYRYIREDDELWRKLHKGMLTTGLLNSALGLYEQAAGKILGIGRGWISHSKIVAVYHHLLEMEYLPSMQGVHEQQHVATTVEDTAELNMSIHRLYNKPSEKLSRQLVYSLDISERQKSFEAAKLTKARSLQSMGLSEVRCAWGSAQEASSLAMLCHLFKDKTLFEVGLLALEDTYVENMYGFGPHQLPPLGATPDGMLVHKVCDEEESSRLFYTLEECEVVEIKNTCPFSVSSNQKRKTRFSVRDAGPRERCDPLFVPQLQFHMLCSGANSALLVSRSATKGEIS